EASHQGFPEIPTPKPTKKEEHTEKKKKKNRKWRPPSGYILFSKESRRIINAESPDISFGEISRLVGVQWRNLNKEDKEKYEERAKRIAEEQLAKQQEATKAMNDSLQGQWDSSGGKGSPAPSNRPGTPGGMQGQYQGHMVQGLHNGVPRLTPHSGMSPGRQYMPPYHGTPTGMRPMTGGYPNTPPNSMLPGHLAGTPQGGQQMAPPPPPPPPPRPPSPMFVSVPPRTQRLLHSEAYLRYIEGLRADKPFISDWDKNLTANAENTSTDPNRLPAHWLAEGPGYHGNTSNALWALRDLMLKDTLNISRTLSFEAL
uniref:HMG box domain-containing protein n=1 Tax=Magallana gigas TaxID=29159 RepID=A0A8W8M5L2_MAGGI